MTDFITDPVEKEKALEDLGRPVEEKPITFASRGRAPRASRAARACR